MGAESQLFLKNLANKLPLKTGEGYASTMTWLRTRFSFEILRSANMCLRGSRTPFRYNKDTLDVQFYSGHEVMSVSYFILFLALFQNFLFFNGFYHASPYLGE